MAKGNLSLVFMNFPIKGPFSSGISQPCLMPWVDIWSIPVDPLCPRRVGSNFWAAQKTTRCDGSCSCYQTDHVGRPQLIVIWHGHHRENEVLIQWGKWQMLPYFCWQTWCFRDLIKHVWPDFYSKGRDQICVEASTSRAFQEERRV